MLAQQSEPSRLNKVEVLYATETGNAYELSILACLSLKDKVSDWQSIKENTKFQSGSLYIFLISTTGQGDPPYSMRPFWKKIMSKNFPKLSGVKFCVYGLGDRSYGDNFNISARKLRQRMIMLGAEEVVEIGLGDEQDGNGCFGEYFQSFYPKLKQYLTPIEIDGPKIDFERELFKKKIQTKSKRKQEKKLMQFTIAEQKILSSVEGRDVHWVSLEYRDKPEEIKIGDILQIIPQNSPETVQEVYLYFQSNGLNDLQMEEATLKEYLRISANLENILNFTFFRNSGQNDLYQYICKTVDPQISNMLTQKLQQLSTDYNEYFNYIKKFRRNVREVITDFSLKLPLSQFIKRTGTIIPRKYSIAQISSGSNRISLLVKLENHVVSSNRIVTGLCTSDLTSEKSLGQVRLGSILGNGEFELNTDPNLEGKIIMISLGTGIAPFLSIISDVLQKKQSKLELILFHSSRFLLEVPLKEDLMEALIKQEKLKIFLTYTREKSIKEGLENRRIQFLVRDNLELFKNMKDGKIMICGVKQFCDIICRILEEELGLDVKSLRKRKVICVENW